MPKPDIDKKKEKKEKKEGKKDKNEKEKVEEVKVKKERVPYEDLPNKIKKRMEKRVAKRE